MNRFLQKQAKRLFLRSMQDLQGGFLELVCPDATYTFGDSASSLRGMAVVHDECFFLRALTGADIGIGESYMDGDWSSPDLVTLVRVVVRNLRLVDSSHRLTSAIRTFASRIRHRLRANTVEGSRRNIREHYDLGNDFYRLFLDEQMNYSSAYFLRDGDSLETAQQQKLDLICKKLRIEPGDRVLEIGCGWGAFAIHAVRHYGAHVTGLTISQAQYDYASACVASSQLGAGSVQLLFEDYRKMRGQFDKIVSIEMFEAVGLRRYDEFFSTCDRLLTPDGSMLLQTITLPDRQFTGYRKRIDWIQTYIFPGSELASLAEVQRSLARATQLSMINAETLGMHYAQTLAMWRERFFRNLESVQQLGFGERFQRMWDFYLGWCEGAFRERYTNVAQLVFAKNGSQRPLVGDPLAAKAMAVGASGR